MNCVDWKKTEVFNYPWVVSEVLSLNSLDDIHCLQHEVRGGSGSAMLFCEGRSDLGNTSLEWRLQGVRLPWNTLKHKYDWIHMDGEESILFLAESDTRYPRLAPQGTCIWTPTHSGIGKNNKRLQTENNTFASHGMNTADKQHNSREALKTKTISTSLWFEARHRYL